MRMFFAASLFAQIVRQTFFKGKVRVRSFKSLILRDYGNCNKYSFWNIGNEYCSNEDKDLGCSV